MEAARRVIRILVREWTFRDLVLTGRNGWMILS